MKAYVWLLSLSMLFLLLVHIVLLSAGKSFLLPGKSPPEWLYHSSTTHWIMDVCVVSSF